MIRFNTKSRLAQLLFFSFLLSTAFVTPVSAAEAPADTAKWNDTITIDGPLIKGPGPSACRLWLPDGVERVRAIFLFTTYGCWGDFAAGPQIRDLARDLQCGIVLTEFYQHEATFAAPLMAALQTLATRSGHPEVAHAPLFVFSHSNSTPGMAHFAALYPTRIAGWVAMMSAGGGQFSVPGIYRIPGMVVSGENDGYFQNQLETVRKLRREHGALMHMLVEAGGGHWPREGLTGPTYQIMLAFLKNVFYLRVPADGDATLAPIKLNEMVEADGWLGQNVFGRRIMVQGEKDRKMEWEQPTDVKRLLEISPFADFPGDVRDASWLPSADYARKWQEYCNTGTVKDWARMPPGTVDAWQAKRRLPAIEGLESTLLASQVKQLATDSDSTAALKELRGLAAASGQPDTSAEATRLLGVLDQLGRERLAQAKRLEATHPPSALVAYQAVVRRFEGFAVADAARERVQAKELNREVAAWTALDRIIQLDNTLATPKFLGVVRMKPRTDEERFAGDNRKILKEIDGAGNDLLREFADTVAAKEARAMLTRLGIPILALFAPPLSQAEESRDLEMVVQPFLKQHCVECHSADVQEGDLRLDNLKMPDVDPATMPMWLTILERVTEHEMPPAEVEDQPIDAERDRFVKPLEKMLILARGEQIKREGRVVWRRLNRVEYENTLRDLLVLPHLHVKEILAPDSSAHGFDNVSDSQDVTYVQMKRYLEAADYALSQASMIPVPSVSQVVRVNFADLGSFKMYYRFGDAVLIFRESNDTRNRNQLSFGTPIVEGEYRFRVHCRGGMVDFRENIRRDIGDKVTEKRVPNDNDIQRKLLPSPIQHVAAIRGRDDRLLPFFDVPKDFGVAEFTSYLYAKEVLHFYVATSTAADYQPHRIAVDWIEIEGPLSSTWPPENARVLFGDLITKGGDVVPRDPSGDARQLLAAFMERAFRRPISPSEVQPFADLVAGKIATGTSFKDALCFGYKAILCAPDFLFFCEQPGPLDAYALANRLSYFLWRSMPDEELLETARNGSLITPSVLRSQAERMMNDPRISRLVEDFSAQWLDLSKLNDTFPSKDLYPDYVWDRYLFESLRQETLHFVADMIASDMPAKSVVSAPIAWLNERLAIHYDVPGRENITGSTLRRVELPKESPRGGLLTQGAILKVTANGTTTSPVIRGAWVMDRVLGTPPRPAPPGVGSVEPDIRGATTIREQLAKHRADPSCAACHSSIDPPGFALECFDVMGGMRAQYRTTGRGKEEEVQILARSAKIKNGPAVDASGEFEKASFKHINDFRTLLVTKEERQIARNLAERLVTVATGAGVNIADRAHIEMILNTSSKKGYGMRTMMQEIIASPLFLSK